jgi:hypothetical protein
MKNKMALGFGCLVVLVMVVVAEGRLVRPWTDAELMDKSDLVVIATPISTRDLAETSSLGWEGGLFRGVETTFKVLNARKGMPANDRIILHHYRTENWFPPNGPGLINFTPNSTNQLMLYLMGDGTNRYAPVAGQIDPGLSIKPVPKNPGWIGMPSVPPMADADPTVRHTVSVHVPVRLHARHDGNSIEIETDELMVTNLTVGANMATGTACETNVRQNGKLLTLGDSSLRGGFADGGYSDNLTLALDKPLKSEESFTVEVKLTLFETDEPTQHFWLPQSGKKFRVLCEKTFSLEVN